MRTLKLLAPLAVVAMTLLAAAQTVNLRPGKYETTAEMDMPGMKMPPLKDVQCITAEDLKDLSKAMIEKAMTDPEEAINCKVSNYKVTGNKVTFDTTCEEDGMKITSTSELTYTRESYTGIMKSKDDKGRVTTIRTTAKRIGECGKK